MEPVSLEEMIECAARELRLREIHYPRWVEQHKLTQKTADLEIARMRAIHQNLVLQRPFVVVAP